MYSKHCKTLYTIVASALLSFSSVAADYREFITLPEGNNDALTFDKEGNLFVSHSGKFSSTGLQGTLVYKISPTGEITQSATNYRGPLGHDFDAQGNMYVANYNTGSIDKVNASGLLSRFANIGAAGFASGILINQHNEMYVASYSGNAIFKIDMSGKHKLWLEDKRFDGPVGITADEHNNIYVGNYNNGRIFKITPTKEITELAKSPDAAGYITYLHGNIYATGINTNKIYRIPTSGGVAKELAGSANAGFNFPNGITSNKEGDKIFVSNYQNNKIIIIENFNQVDHQK